MIEIKVNVELGLNPILEGFVKMFLANPSPSLVKNDVTSEIVLNTEQIEPAGAEVLPVPEPDTTQKPKQRDYTKEDVRTTIANMRKRFEGDDYTTNPNSEGYKKYHKLLTAYFKHIAYLIGNVNKPSELDQNGRNTFIAQMDATTTEMLDSLGVDEKGQIYDLPAPY